MNNETIFHVIKDPVHGTMQFTTMENNWIKPFIDSPNFQRLRQIKQLGMGDYIFPGAVHTRFNHCLGCCYVANQISRKIGLAEEEQQLVIIACLLHDIGHGPFSHTFEDVFHNKLIRHEAWTPYFLADYCSDAFFHEYNRRNPRHHMSEEKFKLIEAMIMHKSQERRVLADIVSSQLDADRLDYLLRDSHFCGVAYGEFDLRWILNSMVIVDCNDTERLALNVKGIGGVEHYLMARRLMMRNIYHHHKKLAIEFLLVQLLSNLASSLATYSAYADIKPTLLGKFLLAVNEFNEAAVSSNQIDQLKTSFLKTNYACYKDLCDYDIFAVVKLLSQIENNHVAAQIAHRLQHRHMPKIIPIDQANIHVAKELITEFKHTHRDTFQDWQFTLIQTPHQAYTNEADPILILTEYGKIKPLNEMSQIINAISDKQEHTSFLSIDRVIFSHPEIQKIVKRLAFDLAIA